jgi:flagellar hook-basal body complex protein FliE
MEITRIPISAYRFSTIGQTAKSDGTESQAAALVGSFGDVLGKALTQVNEHNSHARILAIGHARLARYARIIHKLLKRLF